MKRVTDKVREEIKSLGKYYGVTKCYVNNEVINCRELPKLIVNDKLIKDVKVCNERLGKCLTAPKGSKVKIIEVMGVEVYLVKDECEEVSRRERIGYIITGKGEGRSVRSDFEGKILYIEEVIGEKYDHYRVYLLVKG